MVVHLNGSQGINCTPGDNPLGEYRVDIVYRGRHLERKWGAAAAHWRTERWKEISVLGGEGAGG